MTNVAIQDIPAAASALADQVLGVKGGVAKLFALNALTIGYIASGTGAVTRSMQDRLREASGVMLTDYYNSATDGSNYTPALTRALAVSKTVYFPAGSFTFNTPVDINGMSGMMLIGNAPLYASSSDGATVCVANAGFLTNSTTTRATIRIRNLHIKGNGTAGTVGINGPFGGVMWDSKVENFPIAVQNLSSYLMRAIGCVFKFCTTGLMLADTNGVHIEDCHFDSSCGTAVDNVTGTPQSGGNTGNPMIIRGCNVNCGNQYYSNNSKFKVRGNVVCYSNYFEDFSVTGASGIIFFDYTAGRFDDMGLLFYGNEMNGQGHALAALRVASSSAGLSAPGNGAVYSNRMIGFTGPAIIAGTNNIVNNLRIYDNGPSGTQISGLSPVAVYRPMANTSFTTVTTMNTTSYVDLPIVQTVGYDNSTGAGVAANAFRCRKAGVYQLTATVVVRNNTASALPNVDIQMTQGGTQCARSLVNLPAASGATPAYETITLTAVVSLAANTDIKVQGRNGESAFSGQLTAVWMGDGFA